MKKRLKHNMPKKKAPVIAGDECEALHDGEPALEKRRLRISQSDSCFLEFLNKDRYAVPTFCDIAITVCGEMFSAHRVVLAFGSSYFYAKLSENPQLDQMSFDNVDSSTFEHLLNFLYTSEMEVQQSQIPSLSEAACFFDMMEAVNLLAGEASPDQVPEKSEKVVGLSVEEPQSSSGDIKKSETPGETQCLLCSRTFFYKKSLENHMAKIHSPAVVNETVRSTRTLTHQRRTLSKTESQESPRMENCKKQDVDEGATSEDEDDDNDKADDNNYTNGEEKQHKQKATGPALEVGICLRSMEDADCSKELKSSFCHVTKASDISVALSSGGHVYPEGLAPVIIQQGNKKTLKCPKCDKMFDRIGEIT